MTTPISQMSQANELARAIVRNFDTNRDGKLSTDEFGAFLTNLVAGIRKSDGSANATASGPHPQPNDQSLIGLGPAPPLVKPPIDLVPVPPLVEPPAGSEPSSPPVSSSPVDDSNQTIDINGPFFTNMPLLPLAPGVDGEPEVPGGVEGGGGFAGIDAGVEFRRVVHPSPVSLLPDVQSPVGTVRSPSTRRLSRTS